MSKQKEAIVNMFWKMNSEGEGYYFHHYTSSKNVRQRLYEEGVDVKGTDLMFCKWEKFEESYKELKKEMAKLKEKFNISDEEIEC